MKKNVLIVAAVVSAAAIAVAITLFVVNGQSKASAKKQPPVATLDVAGEGADSPAATDEKDPTASKPAAGGSGAGDGSTAAAAPPSVVKIAQQLGDLWPAYSSEMTAQDRTTQLSAAITNAEEWGDFLPSIHLTKAGSGNPTWRTESVVTAPAVVAENYSFCDQGECQMQVTSTLLAKHWSGGGNYRGADNGPRGYIFTITPDGKLLDVEEPTL